MRMVELYICPRPWKFLIAGKISSNLLKCYYPPTQTSKPEVQKRSPKQQTYLYPLKGPCPISLTAPSTSPVHPAFPQPLHRLNSWFEIEHLQQTHIPLRINDLIFILIIALRYEPMWAGGKSKLSPTSFRGEIATYLQQKSRMVMIVNK